jgi:deoxyribonuclease-1-like protein
MRRYVLISIFLCVSCFAVFAAVAGAPSSGLGDDCLLTIAAFNAMQFGWGGQRCKDISQLAEVFEPYDVVGIVEVMRNTGGCSEYAEGDDGHLHALVAALNERSPSWAFVQSEISVGSGSYREYYAFVYRKDRVTAICSGAFYPDPGSRFERPPFFASFRAGGFEFTAVLVHVLWGDGRLDPIAEVEALAGVWNHVQGLDPDQNNILLMGDFNVHTPTAPAFSGLYALGVTPLLTEGGSYTTYSTRVSQISSRWYDNIWTDLTHTSPWYTGVSGVDYLHERFYTDSATPHLAVRSAISDHCPVWAQFSICEPVAGP